jgi:hypothetical protein
VTPILPTDTDSETVAAAAAAASTRMTLTRIVDLADLAATRRDTDQQTLIWNEITARKSKLEEENQLLRDKLQDARAANKALRTQLRHSSSGGGLTLAAKKRIESSFSAVNEETGTITAAPGLLKRGLFGRNRRDAFLNPAAPGKKRFHVRPLRPSARSAGASAATTTTKILLPLPSSAASSDLVRHILPLPDDKDPVVVNKHQPVVRYHGSLEIATRASSSSVSKKPIPLREIVVPAAPLSSSPETVPETVASPSVSPARSSSSQPPRGTYIHDPNEIPQQEPKPQTEPRHHRDLNNHRQHHRDQPPTPSRKEDNNGELAHESLNRSLSMRRQVTTESAATVPKSNSRNHHHPYDQNRNQPRTLKESAIPSTTSSSSTTTSPWSCAMTTLASLPAPFGPAEQQRHHSYRSRPRRQHSLSPVHDDDNDQEEESSGAANIEEKKYEDECEYLEEEYVGFHEGSGCQAPSSAMMMTMLAGSDFPTSFLERFSSGARIIGSSATGKRDEDRIGGGGGDGLAPSCSSPPTFLVPMSSSRHHSPSSPAYYDLSMAPDEAIPESYRYYDYSCHPLPSSSKHHPPRRPLYGVQGERNYR